MKWLPMLILLGATPAVAADSGLQTLAQSKTNVQTGVVYLTEVLTRDGETNLVRNTRIKSGEVQFRMHRFYHKSVLVGDFTAGQSSSGFTSEPGIPYAVGLEFGTSTNLVSLVVAANDGTFVEAYTHTNGVFYPVSGEHLKRAQSESDSTKAAMERLKGKQQR